MSFPPALPHDPIEQIAPDLFMVRGCVKLNALMTITRNMAILRHEGELTLINPVRLDATGDARLRELGVPKRILRLGPMHGCDDPYYRQEFGVELWAVGDSESYPEPKPDVYVTPETALPFPNARYLPIDGAKQKEGVLLLERDGGILLTVDAIQHYGDYQHNNLPARIMMPLIGFAKTTILGPMWLKMMTPEGTSLEASFRTLLEHRFEKLFSAHGSLLEHGARDMLEAAIVKAYPAR